MKFLLFTALAFAKPVYDEARIWDKLGALVGTEITLIGWKVPDQAELYVSRIALKEMPPREILVHVSGTIPAKIALKKRVKVLGLLRASTSKEAAYELEATRINNIK